MAKLTTEAIGIEIYGTVILESRLASVTVALRTSAGFAGSIQAEDFDSAVRGWFGTLREQEPDEVVTMDFANRACILKWEALEDNYVILNYLLVGPGFQRLRGRARVERAIVREFADDVLLEVFGSGRSAF